MSLRPTLHLRGSPLRTTRYGPFPVVTRTTHHDVECGRRSSFPEWGVQGPGLGLDNVTSSKVRDLKWCPDPVVGVVSFVTGRSPFSTRGRRTSRTSPVRVGKKPGRHGGGTRRRPVARPETGNRERQRRSGPEGPRVRTSDSGPLCPWRGHPNHVVRGTILGGLALDSPRRFRHRKDRRR